MRMKKCEIEHLIINELKSIFDELPRSVIMDIIKYQFIFVHNNIEEGTMLPITIGNLGVFKIRKSVLKNPVRLSLVQNRRVNGYRHNNKNYKRRLNNYDKKFK